MFKYVNIKVLNDPYLNVLPTSDSKYQGRNLIKTKFGLESKIYVSFLI